MSTIDDGGPAFPAYWYDRDSTGEQVVRESYPGATLRDYFAAKAMVAGHGFSKHDGEYAARAVSAYAMADAMLRARRESAE